MLKYSSFCRHYRGRIFEIRSLRRLVHTYVPILGRPGRSGAMLRIMAIISCFAPFEPIFMNQDDSKQCEHLLSQQNEASYSALAPLNLH